jgi:hypothetical protein
MTTATAQKHCAFLRPSGTGKSHFIEALGHLAIDEGKAVTWHTLETLAQLFRRHRADDSNIKSDLKADPLRPNPDRRRRPLVGLPQSGRGAVQSRRRRLRATIDRALIQHPPVRVRRAEPKTLVTATVDRLLHNAHVIITNGTQAHIA